MVLIGKGDQAVVADLSSRDTYHEMLCKEWDILIGDCRLPRFSELCMVEAARRGYTF